MNILDAKRRLLPEGQYRGGGDSGGGGTSTQISDVPEWAKPYAQEVLAKGSALSQTPYQPYSGQRQANFDPLQTKSFEGIGGLKVPYQTGAASDAAMQATQRAFDTQYNPGQFFNQYQGPQQYQGGNFNAQQVNAERVSAPQLQSLNMQAARDVGTQSFTQPNTASQYMNPYTQNVVNVQQREAQRQADIAGAAQGAQAARAGAFGGGRDAVMRSEAARNLAMQKGNIQATGQQAAFENAQRQFNAEQQMGLQANLANQGVQQQANLQNLSAGLQTQGLGAQTGLQAQGMNQSTGLQAQQANQQYGLNAQQMAEQSRQYGYGQQMSNAQNQAQYGQAAAQLAEQARQYGAGLGLQGIQTALTGAGQLGAMGQNQYNQQTGIYGLQNQYGTQRQQQDQNMLQQQYQDFQNQQRYPYQQLDYMSSLIRGTPMGTVNTLYQAPPSPVSQLAGLGTAAYGASKIMASGGQVQDAPYREKPAGLVDLAIAKMA